MSAQLYPSAQAALEDGTLTWLSNQMKVALMGPLFVPNFSHQFFNQLPGEHIIATSTNLANRTFVGNVAKSDPAHFLQLLSSLSITSAVLYENTGVPTTSRLMAFYTGNNLLGSPLVPFGLDQFVYPDAVLGWLSFEDLEFSGEINTYEFAGTDTVALGEVIGGTEAPASVLSLGGRLVVNTQSVCARPDEVESCCRPRIRSSRCA